MQGLSGTWGETFGHTIDGANLQEPANTSSDLSKG
jgi:hypothetical protein